jgi:hypothetical protein
MLCSTFPYPPTRGGTQGRTFNLLKYLSQHHAVTLITQRSQDVTESEIEGLRHWVDELVVFPRPGDAQGGILGKVQRFGRFLQQGTPPNVLHLYSAEIQQWVDEAVAAGKFEVITCEHSVNEIYVRPQWQHQLRTVVNVIVRFTGRARTSWKRERQTISYGISCFCRCCAAMNSDPVTSFLTLW